MAYARDAIDISLKPASTTVGASQAQGVAVSQEMGELGPGMSILLAASVTNVTNASTNAKLRVQHAAKAKADGTYSWVTLVDSAALITNVAEAVIEIRASVWDGTNGAKFPMGSRFRLVCVTGAGDSVTVGQVVWTPTRH
jgi:hypothetical protein